MILEFGHSSLLQRLGGCAIVREATRVSGWAANNSCKGKALNLFGPKVRTIVIKLKR